MAAARAIAILWLMTDTPAATASATDSITIVLADDHTVVRHGLRLLLEAEDDIEVVAEAGDVDSAKRYMLGHKPDVLVLDLNMPGRLQPRGDPARLPRPRRARRWSC